MNADKHGPRSVLICALLLLLAAGGSVSSNPTKEQWRLVWADEFDYTGLPNPAKWGYDGWRSITFVFISFSRG